MPRNLSPKGSRPIAEKIDKALNNKWGTGSWSAKSRNAHGSPTTTMNGDFPGRAYEGPTQKRKK